MGPRADSKGAAAGDSTKEGQAIHEPDAWRLGYFDARELPEYLVMRSNQERFRRFQQEHRSRVRRRFYITVVPKTLDLLEYCLKLLPTDLNVFLILNGLADWERAYLATEFPDIPCFTLEVGSGSILYDRILDLLMEENEFDFGVLDQDCFVLDESLFDQLQFQRNELVMSPFFTRNAKAGIEFPRTYFLYFNVPIVKSIRDKYRISFKRCWTLPAGLEEKLAELNLGYQNFPHFSLNYFDNFQLIWPWRCTSGFRSGECRRCKGGVRPGVSRLSTSARAMPISPSRTGTP